MALIRSLRPNVTRDQAIQLFHSAGPGRWLRDLSWGPLRSVAEVYIPFHLFQVGIQNRGRSEQCLLGLDAVAGTLDLYEFQHLPTDPETLCLETRNCPAPRLGHEHASELLLAKLRRILYGRGFFRLRDLQLSATPLPGELHIPYWLAFRGSGRGTRVAVLDAVRRRPEGAKVRRLIEAWLLDVAEP
jgi:hypothetical protein